MRPGLLWLVFTPLAKDASERNLRLAVQAARQRAHSRDELHDIASAVHVMAIAKADTGNPSARIIAMFKEEGLLERRWLFQQGLEKGIERGARALRHMLLTALSVRKLRVTPAQKARILAATDLETLERWTRNALTAKTTGAIFEDPAATKPRRPRR